LPIAIGCDPDHRDAERTMTLALRTLRASVIGLIVLGLLVFVPAGTLAYWQGWAFIVVFTVTTNAIGLWLALHDPALLERRLKVGPQAESRPLQKILITIALIMLFALPAFSSLDHHLGWSHVPAWLSVLGNVLVALGLLINLVVFRENSFGASTIQRMEGQRVITSGPYVLVRHPMYAGVLVMLAGVPLALGSYWGLLLAFTGVPILVLRILDEEDMLRRELEGYEAYAQDVRYRLMPGVW
jgi:protein-S-isoprenylcysteine O-methyltransferase Ste14